MLNGKLIFRISSIIVLMEGLIMLLPFCFACAFREFQTASSFFVIAIICIAFGGTIHRVSRRQEISMRHFRKDYITVVLCWFVVILIGALPYYLARQGYSFSDCLFESCAGWTTTGATVMDYADMPRSLILWKCISSWFGGMGIIVLTTSVFPRLGIGGQKMAASELPGPALEKLSARFGDTAKITYSIYIALTAIEFLLLLPTGIGTYYALVNTLASVSTGGFINLTASQTAFVITPYIKGIFALFSMASSVCFIGYFYLAIGKWRAALGIYEIKAYFRIIGVLSLLVAISLFINETYRGFLNCLGNAVVQVIAFCSTSGYIIDDIGNWPSFCKFALIIAVFIGGCSFSTSGSIKVIRFSVFLRLIHRGIYKRIHPQAIKPVMLGKNVVSARTASIVASFILLFFGLFMFSSLVVSLDNFDMETTFSAVLAVITNNGTGFGKVTGSDFSMFSAPICLYLTFLMLAGRLELYTMIIVLSRSYWDNDRTK